MRQLGLLLAAVWAGAGCAGGGGTADAGCVPAACAASCTALAYRVGVCDHGICRCSGAFDADADADDGGTAEAEADVADEGSDDAGPEDVGAESMCEGFDSAGVAGTYHGTFAGMIRSPVGDGPMEGDVDFVMAETGSALWSFEGTMSGTAMDGSYPWTCSVQGLVDCGQLEGVFYDGSVEIEGVPYGFEGTMGSSFEPYRFPDGTFAGSCTDCPFVVTGDGTWTATHL